MGFISMLRPVTDEMDESGGTDGSEETDESEASDAADESNEHLYPERWTERLFRDHERRHAYDDQTGPALSAWQEAFRADLRATLGLPAIEAAGIPSLAPERHETVSEGGYERQRWTVRTETGFRLPFRVLLPDDIEPPCPVVVALHGHGDGGTAVTAGVPETAEQRREVRDEKRDVAVQAVERGYAALVPTMRGLGELANEDDEELGYRTCHTLQLHAQLFGRSLAGDRVWDGTRLLDFVEDRDEFDEESVTVTGHSGGGAAALFSPQSTSGWTSPRCRRTSVRSRIPSPRSTTASVTTSPASRDSARWPTSPDWSRPARSSRSTAPTTTSSRSRGLDARSTDSSESTPPPRFPKSVHSTLATVATSTTPTASGRSSKTTRKRLVSASNG